MAQSWGAKPRSLIQVHMLKTGRRRGWRVWRVRTLRVPPPRKVETTVTMRQRNTHPPHYTAISECFWKFITYPRRCTINKQRWMGPTWKTAAGVKPSELGPARNRVSLPGDASRSPDANGALPRAPGSAFLAVDTRKRSSGHLGTFELFQLSQGRGFGVQRSSP